MQSKNKKSPTAAEAAHIAQISEQPCAVCDVQGQTEVHEPRQGEWWLSIPLCTDCHRGPKNGLHGKKGMWRLKKMDEWDALAVAIRRNSTGKW